MNRFPYRAVRVRLPRFATLGQHENDIGKEVVARKPRARHGSSWNIPGKNGIKRLLDKQSS